jgi:hypothetical protein
MPEEIAKEAMEMQKQKWADEEAALLKAVPGLRELEEAINAERDYAEDFDKMMDDEYNDGVNPPLKPLVKSSDLKKQYPVASAYLKAERYAESSDVEKYSAGKKAMKRIADGEDYKIVIAEMDKEWSGYCRDHAWD